MIKVIIRLLKITSKQRVNKGTINCSYLTSKYLLNIKNWLGLRIIQITNTIRKTLIDRDKEFLNIKSHIYNTIILSFLEAE